jgi:hypothetical protein
MGMIIWGKCLTGGGLLAKAPTWTFLLQKLATIFRRTVSLSMAICPAAQIVVSDDKDFAASAQRG